MAQIYERPTILSVIPLLGCYQYADKFQLYPHPTKAELPGHDHPLFLELNYDEEVYPERSNDTWHRDVWERERYETLKVGTNPDENWVKVYQQITRSLRKPAIIQEITNALTLFTNHLFFQYDSEGSWFLPMGKNAVSPRMSVWGKRGFWDTPRVILEGFTDTGCDKIPVQDSTRYFGSPRDAIYSDPDKKHEIVFPDVIDTLFDKYFSLPPREKLAYRIACRLYNQAISFSSKLPSLSFVALIMAVEKLMNIDVSRDEPCPECGVPINQEKCKTCSTPKYKSTSRFKAFLAGNYSPDYEKLYGKIYSKRSQLAHGGVFRTELFDMGFCSSNNEDEDRLMRNAEEIVHVSLINWLLHFQKTRERS